jgi:hypothetical protein
MRACVFAVLLLACAPPAVVPGTSALKEVEEPAVAGCRKVGRFAGSSALPGDSGMKQAREEARAKAAAAGATHVVTGQETASPDAAIAAVNAYDCPR